MAADYFIKTISPQTYQQLHDPNLLNGSQTNPIIVPAQQSWQPNNLISNANRMSDANFAFTVNQ